MLNRDLVIPAIATVLLAILFPIYWSNLYGHAFDGFDTAFQQDLYSLSWSDALFMVIGALEIYIYWTLARVLKNHLSLRLARTVLIILACIVAIFHATILFDLFFAITGQEMQPDTFSNSAVVALFIAGGCLLLYSVFAIAFALILLVETARDQVLLKVFAIMLLIIATLQLTMVFAYVNLLLFPMALIVLTLFFSKKPDTLEVV